MSSATTSPDSFELMQIDKAENVTNTHLMALDSSKGDFIVTTSIPTQLAQWVYIQTPPKITMSTPGLNKNSPMVVNTVSPLQISSLGTNITNKNLPLSQAITLPTNQGVILAHNSMNKQQHLFIQKTTSVQTVPVVPVTKNTLAYLTMIKTAQHLASSTPNQKYVIAPMPKLTSNRLPATITTNCVQPKIALMPVALQNTMSKPAANKHKVFNLKIADGQLQTENNGAITVMCDNNQDEDEEGLEVTSFFKCNQGDDNIICNEDKTYELSIIEDSSSKNDVSFTITIPDDNKTQQYRDPHKFPKHGISILKKNFIDSSKTEKTNTLIISPIPNSITTISDSNTKEVKITASSNYTEDSPVILPEQKPIPQKSERRRKSNFAYRKDYDEVIVTPNNSFQQKKDETTVTVTKSDSNSSNNTTMEDIVEIKVIKDNPDINMNEGFDAKKILSWEDGIGTLPGSEIKFHINEFGILEYLKQEEYKQIISKKAKPKKKDDFQEEMRCLECGCYGMPSEFISPKYCSYDCQDVGDKATKQREAKIKRRTKAWLKKNSDLSESKHENNDLLSEEDQSTSNENSQDKFTYPWTCTKKGFSWPKYLNHIQAKAAPVKLFKEAFPYNRNSFRPGMKLEGVDPQHPSYFCVLSVAEVIGYRLRLRFDGYSENYDFWVNADSMDIFPVGWCEKYGHVLHPPRGYTFSDFNWTNYLKQTKSSIAPKHLFANRAGSAICPNGFRVGMKLEAVDRKNTALVCVATVSDMMDNRILVHFDSWDDIYDYWADPTSPYIHPVGWCDQHGHNLTPPNDYPNPETFTWEKYLKESKSVAAPVRAFKQRPVCGFKRGMRLECVDRRVPQLIRAATVDDIRDHQIRISFDGWPDRYSYWVDSDNTNIHPVGWCQKTGHPIEPPLTPDDVYDFLECPTVGCRGQGHINGSQFSTHSSTKDCPYSDENMNKEHILPDRILTPDRQLESVVPISREPRENKSKIRVGRPPKMARLDPPVKIEWNEDEETEPEDIKPLIHKEPTRDSKSSIENSIEEEEEEKICKKEIVPPLTNGYTNVFVEQIWEKHSSHLSEHLKNNTDPREWGEDEVVGFINSLPSCRNHGALFREHKIDGEALLMLSQQDLVDILNIKLGPAIKLYSIIMLLRRNVLS